MGHAGVTGEDRDEETGEDEASVPEFQPDQHPTALIKPAHNHFTVRKHELESDPKSTTRRNKRKQLSPRRSLCEDDDYLSKKAYLPSWSISTQKSMQLHSDGGISLLGRGG